MRFEVGEWRRQTRPVDEHLPLRFSTGASIERLTGQCSRCSAKLEGEDFRGDVLYSEKLVHVTALGYCVACNLLTPFNYDVWDDLSLVGRTESGSMGVWRPSTDSA